MGEHRWGPPTEVIRALRDRYELDCFVETGTHMGDTALWAADFFSTVVTVELAKEYYIEAQLRFRGDPRITLIEGHSPEILAEIRPSLPPSFFWLDAHYSGGPTAGFLYECPVLDEIEAIATDLDRHFVMIDDARLFINAPPPPHRTSDWPPLSVIVAALSAQHPLSITLFEDVVLAAPERYGAEVLSMLRALNVEFFELR